MTIGKPILFSAPMIRAILEGRKTQTRRIVKKYIGEGTRDNPLRMDLIKCPYGQTGGALWVRETFADIGCRTTYRADTEDGAHCVVKKWTASIYMPRIASRITLEIENVRVERLKDISEDDAKAESIVQFANKGYAHHGALSINQNRIAQTDIEFVGDTAADAFCLLWQSINGPESWNENPWVWVVTFEPHQCNIDDYLK